MKRIISSFIIIIMLISLLTGAIFATDNRFATNINVTSGDTTWNDTVGGGGTDYKTVKVEYRLRGDGIRGIQGVWIAVDMDELLWVDPTTSGRSVLIDVKNGTLKNGASPVKYDKVRMYTLKEKVIALDAVDEWSSGAFSFVSAALSSDGGTLYIGLQPMQSGTVSYADFTTVMTLTFAVIGDSGSVSADAVRIIGTAERDRLNQSFIAAMSDGSEGYYYGDKSAADTLAAPTVTGNVFNTDGGDSESESETTPPKQDDESEDETQRPSGTDPDNTPPEQAWKNPFVDVPNNASYIDAIEFVYENGLFKGTSATEFEPDTTMTRAMFVTVLGRLYGVNEKQYRGAAFDDVVAGEWYAPYVKWAASSGIVNGYGDGNFGVDDEVTIEQALVILARYADFCDKYVKSDKTLTKYADYKKISDWAEDAVKWAAENDIYKGSGGMLRPQTPAKRWLVADMFWKYVTIIEDEQ